MGDKKPCDDIFEGLAELLINNGEITASDYNRLRKFDKGVFNIRTTETWSVKYGEYVYWIEAIDGDIVSIRRYTIDEESEDE